MHLIFISSLVPVANPASGYDIANRVIVDAVRLLGRICPALCPSQGNMSVALAAGRVGPWRAACGASLRG